MEPDVTNRSEDAVRRAKYRELIELGSFVQSTAQNNGAINTLKRVNEIVTMSDEINVEVKENTSEIVMDAQVMKVAHEILGSVVQTINNAEISDDEYVVAINRLIGPNKDWDKLAEIGMKISKTFYYSQPLFGTFEEATVIPPKIVKKRLKSQSNNTQQTKPVSVKQQQKEDQAAVYANYAMSQILKLYSRNDNEPLPYYAVIIDPTNFMKTLQNAFQLSFLFRDGIISTGKDIFGYPTIRPTSKSDKESLDESTYQLVSSLTAKFCDKMIERYNITEACLSLDD